MKLIQHLERKLSWRRKQPGVQNAGGKPDAKSRKTAKKFASAAIKVSDKEFSQYIRFSAPLKTVPTSSVPSYEIVSIRCRSPFQATNATVASPVCHRSPSPRREDALDMHIYDKINCHSRLSPPPIEPAYASPVSLVRDARCSSSNLGPITVTSTCRRNRIKTNPWFSSPWANKNTFVTPAYVSRPYSATSENIYESLDNLDYKESKENWAPARLHLSSDQQHQQQSNHLVDWNYRSAQQVQLQSTPISRRVGTYLKAQLPHLLDPYPQSPIAQFSSPDVDPFIEQVPSPEFVNQSHQICSEISNYFDAHQSPKERPRGLLLPPVHEANPSISSTARPSLVGESLLLNKFDSMETIDLMTPEYDQAMSEWSLHEDSYPHGYYQQQNHHQNDSTSSAEQSPSSVKSCKLAKPSKRKRPDSIYSTRQSKKVDKLKCQLKEVVHAAILEAKKEDTKKA